MAPAVEEVERVRTVEGSTPLTVIAGVDIGNATTEVVLTSGGAILGAGRMPTRGRKGSGDSVRGAAALVRRVERQAGRQADEARIAPLRTVDTSVVTVPNTGPPRGRLRVLDLLSTVDRALEPVHVTVWAAPATAWRPG